MMNRSKSLENPLFDHETKKNIHDWLSGNYDEETKSEISSLLESNPQNLIDAFYTHLAFGTGGLRGIMGIGSNRMNVYTIKATTQGLANYLNKTKKKHSVFIGYDSRHSSRLFAEETAKVLAGNQIEVFLTKHIRPTPYVSFGCRKKACSAAIMITASHNPPEYNGYKVYWSDGGQVLPPHDQGIMDEAQKIKDPSMLKEVNSIQHPLIHEIEEEIDQQYISAVKQLAIFPETNQKEGKELKIVYSALHGTGGTLLPQIAKECGFSNLILVNEQMTPDPNFSSVSSPNPENPKALELGTRLMLESNSDLFIATDPDADRVGVVVNHNGNAQILTGNEIAVLCLDHICSALAKQGRLPEKAAFIKTIVTTELFQAICDDYKRPCVNVLTGFKYIAEKIKEWESSKNGLKYVFGGEESLGYLFGTYTRDKDAISSAMLICETALQAKLNGITLVDQLFNLYKKYGVYFEKLLSLNFEEGKKGKLEMKRAVDLFRDQSLTEVNHVSIIIKEDYLSSTRNDLKTNTNSKLELPESDVILFRLEDETKIMIRPSGTEPKIKVYIGLKEPVKSSVEESLKNAKERCETFLNCIKKKLNIK